MLIRVGVRGCCQSDSHTMIVGRGRVEFVRKAGTLGLGVSHGEEFYPLYKDVVRCWTSQASALAVAGNLV